MEIVVTAIALILMVALYQLYEIKSQLAWNQKAPFVNTFATFEGLLEYCRRFMPNCYQSLLHLKDDRRWQARLAYDQFGNFSSDDEGIPLYRYFDALQLLSSGRCHEQRMWSTLQLASYEKHFIEDRVDPKKQIEVLKREFPLPPNFF
jgi:hypothetical protein